MLIIFFSITLYFVLVFFLRIEIFDKIKRMIKSQEIHPNLYIFSTSFKLFGVELGNRMTVVKNENNDLWVHSPININQDIVNQLQKMGNVHSIISPNLLHHLHLAKFIKYFPNIPVYGVDGIEKKQKNVSFQL